MAIELRCRLEEAMTIMEQAEADRWFAEIVEARLRLMPSGVPSQIMRDAVEKALRDDLGYFAGYYDNETRERVEQLFNCAHPYFGKFVENGPPTPEQALRMGFAIGKASIGETEGES